MPQWSASIEIFVPPNVPRQSDPTLVGARGRPFWERRDGAERERRDAAEEVLVSKSLGPDALQNL